MPKAYLIFTHTKNEWKSLLFITGIFFSYNLKNKEIALADRGQGILKTLKRVRSSLHNDKEALKVAFTEKISGRAPESRGNGLKFVRENIKGRKMRLEFYSGNAKAELNDKMKITQSNQKINGCLAILDLIP